MRLPFRGILRHPERPSDIANPAGTETGAFLEDQTTLIPTSPLHLHSFVAIQVGSMKTPDLSSEASYPDQRPAWTNPSIPLIATISLCFLTSAFQEKSRSHHLPMPRKYNSCFPTSVRKDLLTPQSSASLLPYLISCNLQTQTSSNTTSKASRYASRTPLKQAESKYTPIGSLFHSGTSS